MCDLTCDPACFVTRPDDWGWLAGGVDITGMDADEPGFQLQRGMTTPLFIRREAPLPPRRPGSPPSRVMDVDGTGVIHTCSLNTSSLLCMGAEVRHG